MAGNKIPDNKGYWFWIDNYSDTHGCLVLEFRDKLMCFDEFHRRYLPIDAYERSFCVGRWLGKSHAPKIVDRYEIWNGPTVQIGHKNDGRWVKYEDVKEFLIGDEDV